MTSLAVNLRCPDCHVEPGSPHDIGCDVARCPACGIQRLQCHTHADDESLDLLAVWTGVWPGAEECRREDWWAYWSEHDGWVQCDADHPDATEDLNKLVVAGLSRRDLMWSRERQQWLRP